MTWMLRALNLVLLAFLANTLLFCLLLLLSIITVTAVGAIIALILTSPIYVDVSLPNPWPHVQIRLVIRNGNNVTVFVDRVLLFHFDGHVVSNLNPPYAPSR